MNKHLTDIATQPVIDVAIITYNHQDYLDTCLERVIQQQLDGHFRVSIYDDCSTDGTENIARKWLGEYPQIIRYFRHPKNLGIAANWRFAIEHSTAPYLAICEGDDYWTDVRKLKKQLQALENHADAVFCFHPVDLKGKEENITPFQTFSSTAKEEIHSIELIADGNRIHTTSVLFRVSTRFRQLPEWFEKMPSCDYALFMMAAKHGNFLKINQPMAVYRMNSGVWGGGTVAQQYQFWLGQLVQFQQYFADQPLMRARILGSIVRHVRMLEATGAENATDYLDACGNAFLEVFEPIQNRLYALEQERKLPPSISKISGDTRHFVKTKLGLKTKRN